MSSEVLITRLPPGIKGSKGPTTSLFIEEVSTPVPGNDEVRVQVKAVGLNRMDISQREGRYPVPPQAGPILGVEFSGIVSQIGETTEAGGWVIGDEVFGLTYGGLYFHTSSRACVLTSLLVTGAYVILSIRSE